MLIVSVGNRVHRSAVFSECGTYRYELRRIWSYDAVPLIFIMLNPSIADRKGDDPTIRKCMQFARRNSYGGIIVINLFAFKATHPAVLRKALSSGVDIVGPENNDHLLKVIRMQYDVCLAWGVHVRDKQLSARVATVCACLAVHNARMLCLKRTDDGIPMHPLMLPYSCELVPFLNLWRN